MSALLDRLEWYYDTVPRASAGAESIGPFTLFEATEGTPFPYYARPVLGGEGAASVDDVAAVRARQRELGVPETFEWVDEISPGLLPVMEASGLTVHRHPLLVLGRPSWPDDPAGITVRMAGALDGVLPGVKATLDLGFGHGGTAVGAVGVAERDATCDPDDPGVANWRHKMGAGLMAVAVAEGQGGAGPVGGGLHSPRHEVTELGGIATLPAYRRRGIGTAVTAQLVADALESGVEVCFLSAESHEVARVYERVGFERVGTACTAEPPG